MRKFLYSFTVIIFLSACGEGEDLSSRLDQLEQLSRMAENLPSVKDIGDKVNEVDFALQEKVRGYAKRVPRSRGQANRMVYVLGKKPLHEIKKELNRRTREGFKEIQKSKKNRGR